MSGCYLAVVAAAFAGLAGGFELGRRFAWLGVRAMLRDGRLIWYDDLKPWRAKS